jgi:hypothetical protein
MSATHFSRIHFSIILPSKPGSSKWSHCLRFSHQHRLCNSPLPHTCYMPRPPESAWFHHPNTMWWVVDSIKLTVMYSSPLSCYITYISLQFIYLWLATSTRILKRNRIPILVYPKMLHFLSISRVLFSLNVEKEDYKSWSPRYVILPLYCYFISVRIKWKQKLSNLSE